VHDQFGETAELYVLGALSPGEKRQFETHLATCEICADEVRRSTQVMADLASLTAPADPPPAVRDALMARIRLARVRSGWLALAASLVAAVALGGYALQLRGRVTSLEGQLRETGLRAEATEHQVDDLRRAALDARTTMAVLAAPDVARIDLAGQPAASSASARAFWSRSRGLVLTGSNLPALPSGRTYQLWVLTSQPAPISAGLLKPDANGSVSAMFATPTDIPTPIGMAVTLEPEGGVPSPTGDKYLVGLAQ